MSIPVFPIWVVDLLGSGLMIVFSFLCVRLAHRLRAQDRNNVVWTYMLWLSYGLAGFAVSRSVGHIAKRAMLTAGYEDAWTTLKPYSGAINTLMLVLVASITLFFERIWNVYQQILRDKQALQSAHEELLYLNRNLEELVAERSRELVASESKYRRIFEVSPDMIAMIDARGMLIDVNPAGEEMLGVSCPARPGTGVQFQDFFVDLSQWTSMMDALDQNGIVADTEAALRRRDGFQFHALLSAAAESHMNGGTGAIHFLVKDISQRKAIEGQLLQADKLASIGQLAAGIAHEINNPLSMILGYTQLLIRNEDKDTERYNDLRIIEKHTRACKTIVEDLLSFARSRRTRKDTAHIHSAIEDILSVVQHHLELDNVTIEKEFDNRIPDMVLDGEKMKQVFMNLIMNAKQAIGKRGTIRVVTSYDEAQGRVVIQIVDSGSGIEPQHLSRIFDPFFTTKPTGEGTGLGLSVSYGIVKDHGGEILVESTPGKGSTFTLVLPATPRYDQRQA